MVSYFSPSDRLAAPVEAELRSSCGVLFFADPVVAIRALGRRPERARHVTTIRGESASPTEGGRGRVLSWAEAVDRLADFGLRPVPVQVLRSRQEAARYSRDGAGIVLKLDDPAMPHKTEHAAVRADLHDGDAAAAAFDDLTDKCSPTGQVVGQPYIGGGTEVVIGCWTDPELGQVVAVNAGGTLPSWPGRRPSAAAR